jgi:hypothetical protein
VPAGSNRVKLDLNGPEFQEVFFRLELSDLKQVVGSLRTLRELDWNTVYRHTGFQVGSDPARSYAERCHSLLAQAEREDPRDRVSRG